MADVMYITLIAYKFFHYRNLLFQYFLAESAL